MSGLLATSRAEMLDCSGGRAGAQLLSSGVTASVGAWRVRGGWTIAGVMWRHADLRERLQIPFLIGPVYIYFFRVRFGLVVYQACVIYVCLVFALMMVFRIARERRAT